MLTWYSSSVLHGNKQGRKISFPTINLDPSIWPFNQDPGVYSAEVKVDTHTFQGALYYGPRSINQETINVLEIFLLNFSKEIYGETVSFRLHKFIRGVLHFNSFEDMKKQIIQDVEAVQASFKTTNIEQTETTDES